MLIDLNEAEIALIRTYLWEKRSRFDLALATKIENSANRARNAVPDWNLIGYTYGRRSNLALETAWTVAKDENCNRDQMSREDFLRGFAEGRESLL